MSRISRTPSLEETQLRRDALAIAEAGLDAIDTAAVVRRQVSFDGRQLVIAGTTYDTALFGRIFVIGFGKASCAAAVALEGILGGRIASGMVIGNTPSVCESIPTAAGTHPRPSAANVKHSEAIVRLAQRLNADDLVLVLVSGGGSALLCWPSEECEQGTRLYEAALNADLTIRELNTVRKHLSALKGGGLAKQLRPSRVIGLIFSDVPGSHPDMVASGPTYPDETTAADARGIIDRHGLGEYELTETPKDPAIFDRVDNIVLVDNTAALRAMAAEAGRLGFTAVMAGDDCYETPQDMVERMLGLAAPGTAVIAGGEFRLRVPPHAGHGGRNGFAALTALGRIGPDDLFMALASDGHDNSDAAGALADAVTRTHAAERGLDAAAALAEFDDYSFFSASGDLLLTGPTGSNVSDLMLLLRPRTATTAGARS